MHQAAMQHTNARTTPRATQRSTQRTNSAQRAMHQVAGLDYNDYVMFMPRREECDGLKALEDNSGWDRYSRCACAGAMISVEGGSVREGQMTLPQGLSVAGEHVVCQAYYVEDTYLKPQYYDSDFTPQRAFPFFGVVRASVVPPLEPSHTLAHMRFTLRMRLAYPGYVRFVLVEDGEEGGDSAALCGSEARQGAPGGELGELIEGYRSLTMTIAKVGVYRVCHAFVNELASASSDNELAEEQALPRYYLVTLLPCYLATSLLPYCYLTNTYRGAGALHAARAAAPAPRQPCDRLGHAALGARHPAPHLD